MPLIKCYTCIKLELLNAGDSTDSLFSVSPAGVVSAVGVLDKEAVDFYMINVAVSPCMKYIPYFRK